MHSEYTWILCTLQGYYYYFHYEIILLSSSFAFDIRSLEENLFISFLFSFIQFCNLTFFFYFKIFSNNVFETFEIIYWTVCFVCYFCLVMLTCVCNIQVNEFTIHLSSILQHIIKSWVQGLLWHTRYRDMWGCEACCKADQWWIFFLKLLKIQEWKSAGGLQLKAFNGFSIFKELKFLTDQSTGVIYQHIILLFPMFKL